jgi:hypothetical protein
VTSTEPLKRDAMSEVLGPVLLQDAFSEPQDSVISGEAANGTDYVVASIATVTHPVPDVSAADYGQFRTAMAQQLGADAVEMLAGAARKDVGVKTYPDVIATITGAAAPQ